MQTPISINFAQLDWQDHPSIAGIQSKFVQNDSPFPPLDVLIATVAADGEIPWHVHETNSELAYVLQGEGILFYSADKSLESRAEIPLPTGSAIVVPPAVWHRVQNTGSGDLLLFASHMRA